LVSDLAGKAPTSHTHTKSQITDFAHTHPIADLSSFSVTTPANKQVLQYDSATSLWKNATISAGVTVSETAPSSPSTGDQWFNSGTGKSYVYYDSFWVEVGAAGNNTVPDPLHPLLLAFG
jgi:hypothetical protein